MDGTKYTPQQLRDMAQHVLKAKQSGDERYMQFVIIFSVRAGLSTDEAEAYIRKLAL